METINTSEYGYLGLFQTLPVSKVAPLQTWPPSGLMNIHVYKILCILIWYNQLTKFPSTGWYSKTSLPYCSWDLASGVFSNPAKKQRQCHISKTL